jgi:hypothetical protein
VQRLFTWDCASLGRKATSFKPARISFIGTRMLETP